ncbi:MAG: site-specific tyrosine recombinase XerD [Bacteroidales bacterium]|nr:site-specific tyrosine recombinase XerD [Bacteroidales bacterium]MBR7026454.1 site-specific tyrosine recombinase XerD [Bacteroidales bacterium]
MKKDSFGSIPGDFRTYLKLERSMSANTVAAYGRDAEFLFDYLRNEGVSNLEDITGGHLTSYIESLSEAGITKRSQARVISSLKSLFRYLEDEGLVKDNPCDMLDPPKMQKHLPSVLSVEEVLAILDSVDLSRPQGHRNRAMLEMLYSCGLRVSELVNLRISDLFFDEGFIRVIGKGDKQRLIPVGEPAVKAVGFWMDQRRHWPVAKGCEDCLFLNNRGGRISRVAVFTIVKEQAELAGIHKDISPHTFRHSFATHMVENGADLRVVQEMLGHESILTTEIYTHIDTRKWQETILKFHPAGS